MRWSILAGLVAVADASVIGSKPDCCKNREVKEIVKILEIERASAFCSKILCPKTKTATVTATATRYKTASTLTTSTVVIHQTASLTTVATIIDSVTIPNTVTVTPYPVTVTATVSDTTTLTVTSTSTTTNTVCTGNGVMKRDAKPTSPAGVQARGGIKALQYYARNLFEDACSCYVSAPTVTKTVTVTSTQKATKTSTSTILTTVTTQDATAVATLTAHVPTTVTAYVSNTLDPVTVTVTTTNTNTQTATTVAVQTVTTAISKNYQQVSGFANSGCGNGNYNQFFAYNAGSWLDGEQQCACYCNRDSQCKSFFVVQDTNGLFRCSLTYATFDIKNVQCGISFFGQDVAYNVIP